MRERTIKGIADAILDTEEVLATIDCHDFAYARGLRIGNKVLAHIVEREADRQLVDRVQALKRRLK